MDLQRKTLGQLMAGVLGIGNQSKAVKVDAPELDSDASEDEAGDDAAQEDDDAADEQEEAPKKAAEPKAKPARAGTVTLSLAEYNALKADADQARTLKAANATLKTKAAAWDAHQKAIGGAAPKADTTNDAPETEENTEAKEMKRLSERYKGMIPA
ncbi:hypothetical protein [Salmonirosea aquatica]|uniref:Uncharacterized protein n=1 Tax=Salmonirosea aquatica TaxID=2654236 RepID=A0A7C9BGF8_9BACT|nr:hypothetical protein [Cytophagaceae bacterium SJW1-29]